MDAAAWLSVIVLPRFWPCARASAGEITTSATLLALVIARVVIPRVEINIQVPEMEGRYLRVVLLSDGETVHNAFFDRGFKP